jgi:B9 domain-containing protein 1
MPEFLDSKFAAKQEGREMTRVCSNGSVKVSFSVITKELENCGYVSHK